MNRVSEWGVVNGLRESVCVQGSGLCAVVSLVLQGNCIGGKFEHLRDIIAQVKDKSRVGVCLDTCHAFAAGFDIATKAGFDKVTLGRWRCRAVCPSMQPVLAADHASGFLWASLQSTLSPCIPVAL